MHNEYIIIYIIYIYIYIVLILNEAQHVSLIYQFDLMKVR